MPATATDSGTPTPGEARSEEPSATTIDEGTDPTAEEAEKAPADDPAAQRPATDEPVGFMPLAIPPATGNNAVINVSVGGDRTGTTTVAGLAGVQLGLYANASGGTPLFTCTSDVDGDCSFVVPNTQIGGANRDRRFWVRHVAVPAGWFESRLLRTGAGDGSDSISSAYRFRTGPQLRAGLTYTSTSDFMIGTGTRNRTASGGVWQQSRTNPTGLVKCGLDVALVLDISGSVGAEIVNLKAAADTLTDALVGTPSRMSLYSFSTLSPGVNASQNYPALTSVSTAAQAAAFKARYAGWGSLGGTNWDRGLYAAAVGDRADVVVVITDGSPTFYSSPAEGPGTFTRFREMENGIFSANAIKARGSRVIAVGVGSGVEDTSASRNLAAISGPTLNSDYYQSPTYAAAAAALRALALGNCEGSLTVVKQIVPSTNSGEDITGAQPAGSGWTFDGTTTASGIGGLPASLTTTGNGTGAVNFPLTFPGGTTTAPVTVTETQQPGFTLVTQGGSNAVCTRLDTGAAVPVTNVGSLGFSTTAASTYPVSCTVYNRAPQPPASIAVDKQWVINGTVYDEGNQPDGFQATLSLTGPDDADATTQPWGVERSGYSVGDVATVSETTTLASDLCQLTASRVTQANGVTVDAALPYEATLSQASNTYRVTNTVVCDTLLTLAKQVQPAGAAEPTGWTLEAVAPPGALPGPIGTTGTADVTNFSVTPDVTYQLRESGGDPRFAQVDRRSDLQSNPLSTGSMTCIRVDADGTPIPGFNDGLNGGVQVPLGSRVLCTAVNQAAELVLNKVVVNERGGTAVAADWELTATPTGTFPDGLGPVTVTGSDDGEAQLVRPGVEYQLSESGPDGYEQVSVICELDQGPRIEGESITLDPLAKGTCTFTNRDVPASLTLVKTVTNDDGGTAAPTDWTLSADGPTPISGVTGSDAVTAVTVDAGSYDLAETGGPAGYTASDWQCTGGAVTGSVVAVANGAEVTCTIDNDDQPALLTLVKTVDGDAAGSGRVSADWTLTATPDGIGGQAPVSGNGDPASPGGVSEVEVFSGDYLLSEDGPTGFDPGDWICQGGVTQDDTVTVPPGGNVVCTITNTAISPLLTLIKQVVNDDGGTAAPTDWTLTADGPTPVSGSTGDDAVTSAPVMVGEYELSENGPAGYGASDWECTGASETTTDTVTLAEGDEVTCTIVNDDQPARLTLVKRVVNDNGGTAVATEWTLAADGPTPLTGTTGDPAVTGAQIDAGSYELSESDGPDGYDTGNWDCTGGIVTGTEVSISLGAEVTCTITNDDQPAELTLVKEVVNEWGTAGEPADWVLSAGSGVTVIEGVTGAEAVTEAQVPAGSYALAEDGPGGYTAGDWTCEDATIEGSVVTLANGQSATCTIVNTDEPNSPAVTKTVTGVTDDGDGGWQVTYDVVVSNENEQGNGAGTVYDLEDSLLFGEGITITGASVSGPEDVDINPGWDGVDNTLVAEAVPLDANASDAYTVTVTATVATSLTVEAGNCTADSGEEGTGFLNAALVVGPTGESSAEDCAPVEPKPLRPSPTPTPTPTMPVNPPQPPLATTGAQVWPMLALGVGLAASGAFLVVAAQRRRGLR